MINVIEMIMRSYEYIHVLQLFCRDRRKRLSLGIRACIIINAQCNISGFDEKTHLAEPPYSNWFFLFHSSPLSKKPVFHIISFQV